MSPTAVPEHSAPAPPRFADLRDHLNYRRPRHDPLNFASRHRRSNLRIADSLILRAVTVSQNGGERGRKTGEV